MGTVALGLTSLIVDLHGSWDTEDSFLCPRFQAVSNRVMWSPWDNAAQVSTDISISLFPPRALP